MPVTQDPDQNPALDTAPDTTPDPDLNADRDAPKRAAQSAGPTDRPGAEPVRRSVVPPVAGRSLWLAAAWTGAGAAVLCIVASILAVAVTWLPASGASGNADSAVRAGVLVFLAALHGGITVDGVATAFVPLGMTIIVGVVAWRAGCGLADAVEDRGEEGQGRLLRVGALQILVFGIVSAAAAGLVSLGTSSASALSAFVTGVLLFTVTGGVAFVRWSALGDALPVRVPAWNLLQRSARAATAGVACYLGVGALLVAGSLVVHHDRVTALSAQVGGGWSGAPVLLLGVLAAPNAAIAASAYLTGPGFVLGSGTKVSLFTAAHGVLPAFPVLGAVPTGSGAGWPVLALVAATPVLAGGAVAALAMRAPGWLGRLREVAVAALFAALLGLVLAWQGGGAIGDGRLSVIGASPWQLGLALGAQIAVVATAALGVAALAGVLRRSRHARHPERAADSDEVAEPGPLRTALQVVRTAVAAAQPTTPIGPVDDESEHDRDDADTHDAHSDDSDDADTGDVVDPDEVTTRVRPDELAG